MCFEQTKCDIVIALHPWVSFTRLVVVLLYQQPQQRFVTSASSESKAFCSASALFNVRSVVFLYRPVLSSNELERSQPCASSALP